MEVVFSRKDNHISRSKKNKTNKTQNPSKCPRTNWLEFDTNQRRIGITRARNVTVASEQATTTKQTEILQQKKS